MSLRDLSEPVHGLTVVDERTPKQRATHTILVVGTDSFLSGWGKAGSNGTSYAAWACTSDDMGPVERWVRARKEMKRVRIVTDSPRRRFRPRGIGHFHIYVVGENHPARKG